MASYRVCYSIVLRGEAHTCTVQWNPNDTICGGNCSCVLGERSEKKLDTVQLSNNSVERRIQDLVADKQKIGVAI